MTNLTNKCELYKTCLYKVDLLIVPVHKFFYVLDLLECKLNYKQNLFVMFFFKYSNIQL